MPFTVTVSSLPMREVEWGYCSRAATDSVRRGCPNEFHKSAGSVPVSLLSNGLFIIASLDRALCVFMEQTNWKEDRSKERSNSFEMDIIEEGNGNLSKSAHTF